MLYLIDPRGAVWSADTTLGAARARARVDGAQLDDQRWTTAQMRLSYEDYLDLALRHGLAVPHGLMLDSGFVDHALAPARLDASLRNQDELSERLEHVGRDTEDPSPRLPERRRVHEAGRSSLADRQSSAEKKARDIVNAPVRRDLVDHWDRLDGVLPVTVSQELHAEQA